MQNKKRMLLTALLVSGLMLTGSTMTSAVAKVTPLGADYVKPTNTTITLDAATANLKDKAPSKTIEVKIKDPKIQQISNVIYEQVPKRGFPNVAMPMDILQPQVKEKLPAILFVTGGGFVNANKDNDIQLRMHLAEHGYVVASIEYRVAPQARFPQPLEDVKAAVRFLKAHADQFGIDPNHVGVVGGSAGGYLSAFMGTSSGTTQFDKGDNLNVTSDIQAAVDLYGLSDLSQVGSDYSKENQQGHASAGATEALWVNGSPVFGGVDGGVLAHPENVKAANPITYISKTSAPTLFMHGTADTTVSPSQTDLVYQALHKAGIPTERYLVKGAAHGGVYWEQESIFDIITNWFDKYLKK